MILCLKYFYITSMSCKLWWRHGPLNVAFPAELADQVDWKKQTHTSWRIRTVGGGTWVSEGRGNSKMCEASRDSKHYTLKLVPFPEHTYLIATTTRRRSNNKMNKDCELIYPNRPFGLWCCVAGLIGGVSQRLPKSDRDLPRAVKRECKRKILKRDL